MSGNVATAATTAFVSYSWDDGTHKAWVRELATRLRADGVNVTLDQWHVCPGDQLPQFMERAVRDNDYVLIICTPRYKERSDKRMGGVGYEGDIITGEVMTTRNQRKFIPILRSGTWHDAAASWLSGKYYVDLSGSPYPENSYQDLLTTRLGRRVQAPPIGLQNGQQRLRTGQSREVLETHSEEYEPVRITGIVLDEVSVPRMDGTIGSALYRVPFRLSREPSAEWGQLFVEVWNHPPQYTTMHRPGIASVVGDMIVLDGTTVDEVEKYHRDTLVVVLREVNERIKDYEARCRRQRESEIERQERHKREVADFAKTLKFDD